MRERGRAESPELSAEARWEAEQRRSSPRAEQGLRETLVSGGVSLALRVARPGDRASAAGVNAQDWEGWAQPGSWDRSLMEGPRGKRAEEVRTAQCRTRFRERVQDKEEAAGGRAEIKEAGLYRLARRARHYRGDQANGRVSFPECMEHKTQKQMFGLVMKA